MLGIHVLLKPILWFVWFNFTVILIIKIYQGLLSPAEAIVQGGLALLILVGWIIGFHQYVFSFLTPGAKLSTQIKGFVIRFASSLFYLILFVGLFFFNEESRYSKAVYMSALSFMSLFWALILYQRIRLIEDTPSTRLSSAAQGYAVLEGKVSLYENETVRGPHPDFPVMVWYKKYLFTSSAGFLLDDEKGVCTVDPRDAEVITERSHFGSYSFYAIYPHETIFIIGQLQTLSKQRTEFERKSLVTSKIINWKRHPIRFLDYFDKNNDGKIDEVEMRQVKQTAERLVDENLEEVYQEPSTHAISYPEDGRPFIISSIHPDDLITRYKRAMYFHIAAWLLLALFIFAMQVH